MLGQLEEQILIIVLILQKDNEKAYGLLIFNKLKDMGISIVNRSVYNTLHSLETKGLLRSEITESTNQRGGCGKRIYFLENKGLQQLTESYTQKKTEVYKLEAALEKAGKLPANSLSDWEKSQKWLKEHSKEYAGQWVALDGGQLISHSINAKEVFGAARTFTNSQPLIVQVEDPDDPPFAGW